MKTSELVQNVVLHAKGQRHLCFSNVSSGDLGAAINVEIRTCDHKWIIVYQ